MKIRKQHITLPADSFTPVGLYLRLRDQFSNTILLESSDYHTRRNSFSYIGVQSIIDIQADKHHVKTNIEGKESEEVINDPLQVSQRLNDFIFQFECAPILKNEDFEESVFFGATGFDGVQFFEDISFEKTRDDIPFLRYHFYRFVIVFDHFKDELHVFEHQLDKEYDLKLDDLVKVILNRSIPQFKFSKAGEESSNQTDSEFLEIIRKGIKHCELGDVFQMVLSRQFSQKFKGDEFTVYRALRSLNPSPYLFYFDYGDYKLFGSSPEAQVSVKGNKAFVNPIAGTYKRTGDDTADAALAEKLLNDEKENAEHTMLVDLGRNDLSKNGKNVKVEVYKEVQFYSHVIHLVSKVSADVAPKSSINLLGDTFPAGTLSGAPKYKALELINHYEPTGRGLYGGAVGLIGLNGNMNHAIIIRSFVSKNNELKYQAGAGIVALSDPESELQEVHNKLHALRMAMEKAENMFDTQKAKQL
ncbi:anthranilate synthase component I family protein [Marivirga sp. S37H4]|uniref:Anthranilate synthase component 1 n=1 Tax=Marivirga aurantiaca TaxID=2802615 RepID=A0A935CBJ8_9BACT|nr:anthranilate synthase component I family protein [Marivirga aurantiaca]MBK6265408.1 anthranilate synthase component I family protein [Marivirga aurantiaca]